VTRANIKANLVVIDGTRGFGGGEMPREEAWGILREQGGRQPRWLNKQGCQRDHRESGSKHWGDRGKKGKGGRFSPKKATHRHKVLLHKMKVKRLGEQRTKEGGTIEKLRLGARRGRTASRES